VSTVEARRLLAAAIAEHQAGRLAEAEERYRRILARWPGLPDACNLLGLARHQRGDLAGAVTSLRRAVAGNPAHPAYRYNLGNALAATGDFAEAAVAFEAASQSGPLQPEVWFGLGTACMELERYDEAIGAFRRAVGLEAGFADAQFNLGLALARTGRLPEAVTCYRAALKAQPGHQAAGLNLGNALWDLSDRRAALAAYDAVLAVAPEHVGALVNRGRALMSLGERTAARAALERALALDPSAGAAEINLGLLALEAGNHAAAEARFRRAIALRPEHVEAHLDLGLVHQERGELSQAIACCQAALALEPGQPEALLNLANLLAEQGDVAQALPHYRAAIQAAPAWPAARSAMLFALGYDASITADALFAAHRDFEQWCAPPVPATAAPAISTGAVRPEAARPLRIGFVSADFRGHSCGYFIEPLWRGLDREAFEIHAYSDVTRPDAATERLRGLATGWRDLAGRDDGEAADLVRADGIDILFDLGGHTARNRLLMFARKPAPVQVTWLGYGATTGLRAIDWRLSDSLLTPIDGREGFAEGLWRLPRCSLCYLPPAAAPAVAPTPALANGYVTFGSFNTLAKLTPSTVAAWAEIGRAVPDSRFLVKARALADGPTRERVTAAFAAHGLGAERLDLMGHAPALDSHLSLYGRLDIALDTFPYNGGTTTCEALWMGVPVLSHAGDRVVARFGLAQLTAADCVAWAARDTAGLVAAAVDLGADIEALERTRRGLRARVAASSLCDATGFGVAAGDALRQMWTHHRAS